MRWPWVNLDMVMFGRVCVCDGVCAGFWTDRWFPSALVVCRNQGGMSVHAMGGKNTHPHKNTLTYKASVGRMRIMTVRNTCNVPPFDSNPKSVQITHTHTQSIGWRIFSIMLPSTDHLATTRTHRLTHGEAVPLGSWMSLLESLYSDGEERLSIMVGTQAY